MIQQRKCNPRTFLCHICVIYYTNLTRLSCALTQGMPFHPPPFPHQYLWRFVNDFLYTAHVRMCTRLSMIEEGVLFIPACSQCKNVHEQIALKSKACSIIFFHSSEVNEVEGAFFPINFRSIQHASCSVWGQFFSITFMRQQCAGCRAKQVGYMNWQTLCCCCFFFLRDAVNLWHLADLITYP